MRKKLNGGEYRDLDEFCADADLVFSNALSYNHPGSDVYVMAQTLQTFFEKKIRPVEERERKHRLKASEEGTAVSSPRSPSVSSSVSTAPENVGGGAATVVRFTTTQVTTPMSKAEIRQLSGGIHALTSQQRPGLIQLLQRCNPLLPQEGEMEINLMDLEAGTLRQMEAYVLQVNGGHSKKKSSRLKRKQGLGLALRRAPEVTEKEIDTIQRQMDWLQGFPPLPSSPGSLSPLSGPSHEGPLTQHNTEQEQGHPSLSPPRSLSPPHTNHAVEASEHSDVDSDSASVTDSDTDTGSE